MSWVMDALAKLRFLYNRERAKNYIDPPKIVGEISAVEILNLFLEHEKADDASPYKIFDGKYNLCLLEDVMRFVKWASVHDLKYIDDAHDCDDYSFGLAGKFCNQSGWDSLPVGIVVAGSHALCCVVAKMFPDSVPKLFFIEPQSAECVSISDKIWLVLMP